MYYKTINSDSNVKRPFTMNMKGKEKENHILQPLPLQLPISNTKCALLNGQILKDR